MSYRQARFRRVLASTRIAVGLIFLTLGAAKLFDPSFFTLGFQSSLVTMTRVAADWYLPVVEELWRHPGLYALLVGMMEMFLGVGLCLGLATRPVCVAGMLYMLNRIAITWYQGGMESASWQFIGAHVDQFSMFLLFLVLGFGHAGETWGLGALYHHHRFRDMENIHKVKRDAQDVEDDLEFEEDEWDRHSSRSAS